MTAPAGERDTLADRVAYRTRYVDDPAAVLAKILSKSIVPYQVEAQPGRLQGHQLCWMQCPYCYGGSSKNTGERLLPDRYREIIRQTVNGPHGGVDKVIYAGYATDPLNYEHIDDLVETSIELGQVVGLHSKLLRVSERLIELLTRSGNRATNYVTVSVDAGTADSYNVTHGIPGRANLYAKIIENLTRLRRSRDERGAPLDIATNYLVTRVNNDSRVVEKAIIDLVAAGVDAIRFSFPQVPRGTDGVTGTIIPARAEVEEIHRRLAPIIASFGKERTKVLLLDYDGEQRIEEPRSFPCFARFIYPAIAYDGFLSNCSQSAAPHFRDMALGNLATTDFWDAFYDYDAANLRGFLEGQHRKMTNNDCRCDRKEHTVNRIFRRSVAGPA